MNQEITNISLKFACNKNWDNMTDVVNGKYCNSCKKIVYDFTDAKQKEFLAIMAQNNNNVCGKFRIEQMTPQPLLLPIWKKLLSAAMILIGINVFNNAARAQTKPVITTDQHASPDSNKMFGMITTIAPQFPGGLSALSKFLLDNIQYSKGIINGRVILAFTVKKDGSLSDIKAVIGISTANNEEAVRVLKLSPKWIPGTNTGNAVDVTYTLPITFKHKD